MSNTERCEWIAKLPIRCQQVLRMTAMGFPEKQIVQTMQIGKATLWKLKQDINRILGIKAERKGAVALQTRWAVVLGLIDCRDKPEIV